MKKKNLKSLQTYCSRVEKVKNSKGGYILLPIMVMPIVITKRVKVANELYAKSDTELLAAGRLYVTDMTAATTQFPSPSPTLSDCTTQLDNFEADISAAATRDELKVQEKNTQRELLLNMLSTLGEYVESIANAPANAATGAVTIIEMAGMRPKTFTPRQRQQWEVFRGTNAGSIEMTAESIKRGIHEWQYNYTPTNDATWVSIPSTTKARTVITGLTRGAFVSCRHRSVTNTGTSDWQGHDPVVVG